MMNNCINRKYPISVTCNARYVYKLIEKELLPATAILLNNSSDFKDYKKCKNFMRCCTFQKLIDAVRFNNYNLWISTWEEYLSPKKNREEIINNLYILTNKNYHSNFLLPGTGYWWDIIFNREKLFYQVVNLVGHKIPKLAIENDCFGFITCLNDNNIIIEFLCKISN